MIVSLEYLPAEQVPQLPLLKNTIVELPKFNAAKVPRDLRRMWLRFLRETGETKAPAAQEQMEAEFAAAAPEIFERLIPEA